MFPGPSVVGQPAANTARCGLRDRVGGRGRWRLAERPHRIHGRSSGGGRSVYQWWVFVHLVGVFGFLAAHGVSMTVTFKLRTERDPKRISDLLALSGTSIQYFYYSTGLLLLGGIVAGFLGHWWAQGWIWAAIVVLVLTSMAMLGVARPYYRRVGLVARAMAGGSTAV